VLERLPHWEEMLGHAETDSIVTDLFRVVPERRRRKAKGSRRKSDETFQKGELGANGAGGEETASKVATAERPDSKAKPSGVSDEPTPLTVSTGFLSEDASKRRAANRGASRARTN
jgi:hypothetical protein